MNPNRKIRRAPGLTDRAGRDFERLDAAIGTVREVLYAHGYQPIETPFIEQTELFLRRSGGILSSQMFDFTAPDGSAVSLRPELTAPAIRFALEQVDLPLPLRLQYASPILRYTERPLDAPPNAVPSKRQYIQAGAELIGAAQPAADGEIISTAHQMAKQLGISDIVIRVGHVGLIWEILDNFHLSKRAKLFLANQISEFAKCNEASSTIEAEAERLGLARSQDQRTVEAQASAAELLTRLASEAVHLPDEEDEASRTASDVIAGLKSKLDGDSSKEDFPEAIELMRKVAQVKSETVGISRFASNVADLATAYGLDELETQANLLEVIQAAESGGVPQSDIVVDLGLASAMAYYSGMIFDVSARIDGQLVPIGGGGRYDGLATSLGASEELPALGFALNLDTILEITSGAKEQTSSRRYTVLLPDDDDAAGTVVEVAADLRSQGRAVVSLFDPMSDAQAIADELGDAEIVTVARDIDARSNELERE